MPDAINERIQVLAAFDRAGLRPRLFVWGKRRYKVARIAASWTHPEGFFRRYHFAVLTDGANLYELSFSTRDLAWLLVGIHQSWDS